MMRKLIIYYDLNTYQLLQDGSHFNILLNKPTMPSVTTRQAVLSGDKANIVSLQLDAINLLYSRDFITDQLSKAKS